MGYNPMALKERLAMYGKTWGGKMLLLGKAARLGWPIQS
jgi:hypothetical protein